MKKHWKRGEIERGKKKQKRTAQRAEQTQLSFTFLVLFAKLRPVGIHSLYVDGVDILDSKDRTPMRPLAP